MNLGIPKNRPVNAAGGSGVKRFSQLQDGFKLSGNAGKVLGVNDAADKLEPVTLLPNAHQRWALDNFQEVSGSWTYYGLLQQMGAGFIWNGNPGGLNNRIKYNDILLQNGNYTLVVVTARGWNGGVVTVYLDQTNNIGEIDCYKASDEYNWIVTIPNIPITAGSHSLTFKVSAAGDEGRYSFLLTKFDLRLEGA